MTRAFLKTLPSALTPAKGTAALLAIAATSAIAPSAFASNMLFEQKLTVKIAASDLSDMTGVEKTYKMLQDRATSFCKNDTPSLVYLDQSIEDCVDDLMQQFITTSGVATLKTYHETLVQTAAPKTLAMN